jgi:hypothetical protein
VSISSIQYRWLFPPAASTRRIDSANSEPPLPVGCGALRMRAPCLRPTRHGPRRCDTRLPRLHAQVSLSSGMGSRRRPGLTSNFRTAGFEVQSPRGKILVFGFEGHSEGEIGACVRLSRPAAQLQGPRLVHTRCTRISR